MPIRVTVSHHKPTAGITSDRSLWLLLISNLVTIAIAVWAQWDLRTIMVIYWFQSVTIGLFNFFRILSLRDFFTEGVRMNGMAVAPTRGTKIQIALFFLVHYGFFHLIYLVFLTGGFSRRGLPLVGSGQVLIPSAMFFLNHLYSYRYHKPAGGKKLNIGTVMFFPYARIIPMHLTLIFGDIIGGSALPLFLALKTLADALMHIVEHKLVGSGEERQ